MLGYKTASAIRISQLKQAACRRMGSIILYYARLSDTKWKLYSISNVRNYGRRQEALKILQKLNSYHSSQTPPQIFPLSRGESIWSSLDWLVYKIQSFLEVVETEACESCHVPVGSCPLYTPSLAEKGGPLACLTKIPPFPHLEATHFRLLLLRLVLLF